MADMDEAASIKEDENELDAYFRDSVENLLHNHFSASGTDCVICRADTEDHAPNTDTTAIVKIKSCGHVFHKVCLRTWLKSQLVQNNNGSCTMCRDDLVLCFPQRRLKAARDMVEKQYQMYNQNIEIVEASTIPHTDPAWHKVVADMDAAYDLLGEMIQHLTATEEELYQGVE